MRLINYLRGVCVLIITPLLTAITCSTAILLAAVARKSPEELQWLARIWAQTVIRACGVSVTVKGAQNLDQAKSYIFAANHQSQFDIFTLQGYLGIDFRWLAKQELFDIPLFGTSMRVGGYIPINRGKGRESLKSLNNAATKISGGTSVIIFPEGTRSADGNLQEFKSGAIILAIKAQVPIVPVAITGTHEIMPKGTLVPRPGNVTIHIGKPIASDGYKPKQKNELALKVHDAVAALMLPTE